MSFSLHEDGSMRYFFRLGVFYYRQAETPEPTPETTPDPTPDPTLEPTPDPTADAAPSPTADVAPPPDETPLPEDTPEPTPANNGSGNGSPNWPVIAIIAVAVAAIGGIITFFIVWNKKK